MTIKKVGEGQGWNFAYRRGENRLFKTQLSLLLRTVNLSVVFVVFKKKFPQNYLSLLVPPKPHPRQEASSDRNY